MILNQKHSDANVKNDVKQTSYEVNLTNILKQLKMHDLKRAIPKKFLNKELPAEHDEGSVGAREWIPNLCVYLTNDEFIKYLIEYYKVVKNRPDKLNKNVNNAGIIKLRDKSIRTFLLLSNDSLKCLLNYLTPVFSSNMLLNLDVVEVNKASDKPEEKKKNSYMIEFQIIIKGVEHRRCADI